MNSLWTPWRRGWVHSALGAVVLAASLPLQAQAPAAAWQLVVPVASPAYRMDIGSLFAEALRKESGQTLQLQRGSLNQGVEALRSSLAQAPEVPSLVLMPEELALFGDAALHSPQHMIHYQPLLVVLETYWCLVVDERSPLRHAKDLLGWAKSKKMSPLIALPVAHGRMRLWVQGMAERTQRVWGIQTYGIGGDASLALQQGADLALVRCDQQWRNAQKTRVLAKSTKVPMGDWPRVPEFSDLGWMPLGNGWLAWVAPKSLPEPQRKAMAQLLYASSRATHIQSEIVASGQVAVDMTPEASRQYIEAFTRTWHDIGHLMLGDKFGNLPAMAGEARP